MKIEVGKYYKNRTGEVLGPVRHNNDVDYPFEVQMDGYYRSFSTDGGYMLTQKTSNDLVEECNVDGSPIVAEDHIGTASWETTFDKQRRQEIALTVLPALVGLGTDLFDSDMPEDATYAQIAVSQAFYIADEFIKVAKQS